LSSESKASGWGRAERVARAVETWLVVVILGGLILFGAAQILLRNVFSISFAWGDGLTRLAVLWLALLGALAASRDGRHITMGAVGRLLPQRLQRFAQLVADVFAAAVSAALAWYSWVFVSDSREFGDVLLDGIPAWWLQAIMPIAFALMAYQFVAQGIRRLRGRVGVSPPHL
jgi:TRAP-type C4-dicarboxylate transport system permease small subunit